MIKIKPPAPFRSHPAFGLIVFTASLALCVAPASAVLDLDGDGLRDLWQHRYNAHELDAAGDADGDGVSNREESELSSNPFDSNSYFGLRRYEVDDSEGRIDLTFHTAPGNVYQIQSSADLSEGSWRIEKQIVGVDDGVVTTGCFFDKESAPALFYRIRLMADRDEDGDGLSAWEEGLLGLDDTDSNSNGERAGGDMAWVVDRLYSSEPLELTDGTMLVGAPPSIMEVSRFLNQATFGASYEEIEAMALSGISFGDWIDAQMALPVTTMTQAIEEESAFLSPAHYDPTNPNGPSVQPQSFFRNAFWRAALTGDDQLRQRVAFALSEILVISGKGADIVRNVPDAAATYYDHLIDRAFGNYADLLEDVTMNVSMGLYLGHLNNRKAIPELGIFPDENYAREVMQLFSIGLWELNRDGTHRLDSAGNSIPSYTNYHIEELAKVMTGFNWGGTLSFEHYVWNPTLRMTIWASQHDPGEKFLVNGGTIPAGQEPIEDVRDALDNLARHPNTGPFIGRQLIQRFVTSNPSPEYIRRVANAYYDNGSGEAADLGAVIRAILLDPEARSARGITDDKHGKMREPYITYVHLARAFDFSNPEGAHLVYTIYANSLLGQNPLDAQTVFNFFLPDYQPPGELAEAGMYAPEFQIYNSLIAAEWPNTIRRAIRRGIASNPPSDARTLKPDYSDELALVQAGDTQGLIDRLDMIFTYGTLSAGSREVIRSSVEDWTITDEEKLWIAIYLVMTSPEYVILR